MNRLLLGVTLLLLVALCLSGPPGDNHTNTTNTTNTTDDADGGKSGKSNKGKKETGWCEHLQLTTELATCIGEAKANITLLCGCGQQYIDDLFYCDWSPGQCRKMLEVTWKAQLSSCNLQCRGLRPAEKDANASDLADYVRKAYKDVDVKPGRMKKLGDEARKALADSIVEDDIVTSVDAMYAFLVAKPKMTLGLIRAALNKFGPPELKVGSWGGSSAKAILSSFLPDKSGFTQLGLNTTAPGCFLFSVDRMDDGGNVTNNQSFSFTIQVPGLVGALLIKLYNETHPDGVDVTRDCGTVAYVGNYTWNVTLCHTSAVAGFPTDGSQGTPPVVNQNFGTSAEAQQYITGKYKRSDFGVGGVNKMSAADRAALAAAIIETEVIDAGSVVYGYMLATPKLSLNLPIAAGAPNNASAVRFDSWGPSSTKAAVTAVQPNSAGFGVLGLQTSSAKPLAFLFAVDRMKDDGSATNGENFTFTVTMTSATPSLIIKTYNETNPAGTDIMKEGCGAMSYLGANQFQVTVCHTSAISGELGSNVALTSAAPGRASSASIALLLLAPALLAWAQLA